MAPKGGVAADDNCGLSYAVEGVLVPPAVVVCCKGEVPRANPDPSGAPVLTLEAEANMMYLFVVQQQFRYVSIAWKSTGER